MSKRKIYTDEFKTMIAELVLFKYIEGFYNRKRIHSSIGYLTPDEYENMCRAA